MLLTKAIKLGLWCTIVVWTNVITFPIAHLPAALHGTENHQKSLIIHLTEASFKLHEQQNPSNSILTADLCFIVAQYYTKLKAETLLWARWPSSFFSNILPVAWTELFTDWKGFCKCLCICVYMLGWSGPLTNTIFNTIQMTSRHAQTMCACMCVCVCFKMYVGQQCWWFVLAQGHFISGSETIMQKLKNTKKRSVCSVFNLTYESGNNLDDCH